MWNRFLMLTMLTLGFPTYCILPEHLVLDSWARRLANAVVICPAVFLDLPLNSLGHIFIAIWPTSLARLFHLVDFMFSTWFNPWNDELATSKSTGLSSFHARIAVICWGGYSIFRRNRIILIRYRHYIPGHRKVYPQCIPNGFLSMWSTNINYGHMFWIHPGYYLAFGNKQLIPVHHPILTSVI